MGPRRRPRRGHPAGRGQLRQHQRPALGRQLRPHRRRRVDRVDELGGSEFESGYTGGESSTQTAYDADFTTPTGHQGVTFVSAAGDSGEQSGVQWPASSPNVLSVGGTTLTVADDGTYESESGWSGTSSGYSQVEAEPAFQDAVQTTGLRAVSDVAYGADPDSGFAVYDSLLDDGVSGWQEVGGTSAGTPQWAALVAIADQGRVTAGQTTLNGTTQTLPDLYALYAADGTTGYTDTYTAAFNDVVSGGAGQTHFRHGGYGDNANNAAVGYDLVTGLGTPKANVLIADLATAAADTGTVAGGTTTSGGTATGGSSSSSQTLSPVAVTLLSSPINSVIGGVAGTLRLRLSNSGTTTFTGPVTVVLYASTDTAVSTDTDTVVKTLTLPTLRLKAGAAKVVTLKYDYPTTLATGSYYLIAQADATGTSTTPTTAVTSAVTLTAPAVDLSVAFTQATVIVTPGKKGRAVIKLTNLGNVTAVGPVLINLYASATGSVDASAAQVYTVTRKVKLAAGKAMSIALPFTFPADGVAGTDQLVAAISPTTTPTDANAANDVAAVATVAR